METSKNIRRQNHRASKYGCIADLTENQYNISRNYFGGRCAYSGKKLSAESIEHIVPLCSGGESSMFNCIPAENCKNMSKNGTDLLLWFENKGKSEYSSYRLLKIINYIMKVLDNQKIVETDSYSEMEKAIILTPNIVDDFLTEHKSEIYSNEVSEQDNSYEELELEPNGEDVFTDNKGINIKREKLEDFISRLVDRVKKDKIVNNEVVQYLENKLSELKNNKIFDYIEGMREKAGRGDTKTPPKPAIGRQEVVNATRDVSMNKVKDASRIINSERRRARVNGPQR